MVNYKVFTEENWLEFITTLGDVLSKKVDKDSIEAIADRVKKPNVSTVTLEEAKQYLRVDTDDEDDLISYMLLTAEEICAGVARLDISEFLTHSTAKVAILYTVAYLYEHREEADHNKLNLTLRSLLFSIRQETF